MRLKYELPGKMGYGVAPVYVTGDGSAPVVAVEATPDLKGIKVLAIFIICDTDAVIEVYFQEGLSDTTTGGGVEPIVLAKGDRFGLMYTDYYPVGEDNQDLVIDTGAIAFRAVVYYDNIIEPTI